MAHSKKTPAGSQERRELLASHFGDAVEKALADRRRLGCGQDDLLDAFAALWTARRIVGGKAVTLPAHPQRDRFDLPMEMVA